MDELDDLEKYGKKANAMLQVSIGGDCPQVFKLILLRDMVNITLNELKKTGTAKSFREVEIFIDNFLKEIKVELKQTR